MKFEWLEDRRLLSTGLWPVAQTEDGASDAAVVDVGRIDFLELPDQQPVDGAIWYRVEPSRDAILTADLPGMDPAADVSLTLYHREEDGTLTVLEAGQRRLDYASAVAGQDYLLEIEGASPGVDVRLANLVAVSDHAVTVGGTGHHDTFEFAKPADCAISINGVEYHLDFDPSSTVYVSFSGGGGDTVVLRGSAGDDVLTAWPNAAVMSGDGFLVAAEGFDSLLGYAEAGGTDVAYLHGSPGDDTFLATPAYGKLYGPGFYQRAKSFDYVHAYAVEGGDDVAYLSGSPGDDTYLATPVYGKLYGPGFSLRAKSFGEVYAGAGPAGDDRAFLFDSPQVDAFTAALDWSRLANPQLGFLHETAGFDYVWVKSSGAPDTKDVGPTGNMVVETVPEQNWVESSYDVVAYGADPSGESLSTGAIQAAIDACAAAGGGTVRFTPGVFLSGSLWMRSRVTLRLDEGATLLGSRDREDYLGPPTDGLGRPVAGEPVLRSLIYGENLHDVVICGQGTIDGNGDAFSVRSQERPKGIFLASSHNVLVEGVHLRNAGSWMQHYRFVRNLTIRNIDVYNYATFNNDGLDIDSCQDVTVVGSRIDSLDDGIALKSLSDQPVRNVIIRDSTVSSRANAIKLGTESGGGFVDVVITGCKVLAPQYPEGFDDAPPTLAAIALEIVDGGRLENVVISDIDIEGVSVPIFLRLGNRARSYVDGVEPGVGTFRNVRLSNIKAVGASSIGCSITGLVDHPIENITLENIDIRFSGGGTPEDAAREVPELEANYPECTMFGTLPAYGLYVRHVRGLNLVNVHLSADLPDARPAIVLDDVE